MKVRGSSAFVLRGVLIAGAAAASFSCHPGARTKWPLVIVLGIDGMDPGFVSHHWSELPNLRNLSKRGEFKRLGTTMPPQSPVAWSTFSTGMDPAKHGILDFVYRDPHTMTPFSAMDETEEPSHKLTFGLYELPLGSPHVKTFRKGEVFWKMLADYGVPVKILRMPVNYPPVESNGESLSGMGVPDMRGTFGTFTFFTDDPLESLRDVPGGQIVPVQIEDHRVLLNIQGPANPYRRNKARSTVTVAVDVDPFKSVARFRVQEHSFILRAGEWSEWVEARFPIISGLKSAHGIFRVYAKEFNPGFRVYISPVNFDPLRPDARISFPASYSVELAKQIGLFYTQGMPEDTSAFRQNVFDRHEYLTQTRLVSDEQIKMLKQGLAGFREGFLFLHFSGVDQNSHMLWGKFDRDLLETYKLVDETVGWVNNNARNGTLIVMSDHGFTAFDRAVNLNAWLLQEGFLSRTRGPEEENSGNLFSDVDWSKTAAYAFGLNAIYLNLTGRERNGLLSRPAAEKTLSDVEGRLLSLRDPENHRQVVSRVWSPHPEFKGDIEYIPDLIVGFAPGYRSSWEGSMGTSSGPVLSDNLDAWIGDHCMAPEFVPGVLISNRKSSTPSPTLKDLTVSILKLFGVARPDLDGKVIY